MFIELKRESHVPLYIQIVDGIRGSIRDGVVKVGDRLPATRALARLLGVNRTTVATAYAELAADGLISSHVGRGTFISGMPPGGPGPALARSPAATTLPWDALLADQKLDHWLSGVFDSHQADGVISLAYSLPQADLFPLDEFRRCVDRVLRREGRSLLQLGTSRGYGPLQDYLVSQMALAGIRVGSDEVLITNGCQQSLDLIRRVLVGPGEEVVLENPTYPGALSVFCGLNSRYVAVAVKEGGLDLDMLEDILSQRRPKLIYVIPTFNNPTGVSMGLAARKRLIEMALKHRVPIVEDDIYRDMRYEGASVPSLKALDEHGLVIYISSFSKVGFPGLRVGWVSAPRIVIDHLNRAKEKSDFHASLLAQASIHEFSRRGLLARHVKRIKKAYARRRDVMLQALEGYFPSETVWRKPEGGMSLWVKLPDSLNANQILITAAEQGVIFSPGHHFYSSGPNHNFIRLSFTMTSPAEIEEGVRRLGAVIKSRLTRLKGQRAHRGAEAVRVLV